jgi:hypothetical protein
MNLATRRGAPYEYVDVENGKAFFSVTQVRNCMHDTYAGIPVECLEPARKRGELLHTFFWKWLGFRAEVYSRPEILPAYPGYCEAIVNWAEMYSVVPLEVEKRSANLKLGIAGCLDTRCLYGQKRVVTLTDLKTGCGTLTDVAQLLCYDSMEGNKSDQLLDLYIHEDGSYTEKFVKRKDKVEQWPAVLNAINLLKWRRNHGVN